MLSNPLIAYANNYNMQIEDDYAFGVIDGFLVTVFNQGAKKAAHISCCFPTGSDEADNGGYVSSFQFSSEINKLIDSEHSALKDYELTTDSVAFYTSEELKSFDSAVNAIIKLLHDHQVPGIDMCIDCGRLVDDEIKFVVENRTAHAMCKECANEFIEKKTAENATNTKPQRFKGTVAAILGGLLGLFASVFAFWYFIPFDGVFGFNSSLVLFVPISAIITVLTFLFYRLFTGRKSLERILPCLITSAFVSACGVYLTTAIIYAKTLGADTFLAVKKALGTVFAAPISDPYYKSDFLSHVFYSMVMVIIVTLIYSIIFEDKKVSGFKVVSAENYAHKKDETEATE